jgi:peptide/nickel transport system ATP-binding protein
VGCSFEPRCPLAIDRCAAEFPPETRVADGHFTHCWRASEIQIVESLAATDEHEGHVRTHVLLDVEGLLASYGRGSRTRVVVHDVSFSIAAGSCLALVGESGSGKTTIGRCVAGLHEPNGGTIALSGAHLAPHASDRTHAQRRAVQIVFQNPDRSLNPAETLGAAIARPLRLFGLPSSRPDVVALLERVRLPVAYAGRYPKEISGGEKQRAAIARALAARPSLLICDEITSALDVSIQAAIVALLEELQGDGLALLFITHNLALVNSIADEVVVLEAGHVCERGPARDVIRSPTHAYTRELLVAAPELGVVS